MNGLVDEIHHAPHLGDDAPAEVMQLLAKAPPRSDDADLPDVLAKASLRASAFVYYMDGMLGSSTVDLGDLTALAAAFEHAAPEPGLATVDAATLSTVVNDPRFECTQEYGCPYTAMCKNKGRWPIDSTVCYVNDCNDAKRRLCPHWLPDTLKHLVFKSWCSYVCIKSGWKVPPPVVAQGAIGITSVGKMLPDAGLAWCIEP